MSGQKFGERPAQIRAKLHRKLLAASSKEVRQKYHLWRKRAYRAILKCDRTRKAVEVFLYGNVGSGILPHEIREVTSLLYLSNQFHRWTVFEDSKESEHGVYMRVTLVVYPKSHRY